MLVVISRIVWMAAVEARGQDRIDVVQRRTFGILLDGADFEFDLAMVWEVDGFGWTEYAEYPGEYEAPQACRFFREQRDDTDGPQPRGDSPDPLQLVLLADPTEDAATITNADVEVFACTTPTEAAPDAPTQ